MLYIVALIVLAALVLLALQIRILQMTIKTVPEFIAALQARVQPLESAIQGVKTVLSTQQAQLVAIRAQLANQGIPPEQLAPLDDFLTTFDHDTADLVAAAVAVNTGAEGEPQPEPAPEPEPVTVVTTALPTGDVGADYSATIEFSGGTGPYTALSSPPSDNGLTVNEDGTVTGNPIAAGDVTFTVTGKDSLGATGVGTVTVHIDTPV